MLGILKKVEAEAVSQIELNGIQAKKVVSTGINRISIIMLVFFFLMVLLLYLILTDITRSNKYRKELEAATEEAEYHGKAKQRFLSNMSHEIRTPLQSIIGYAELIKQQESPARKYIDAIYHSSEHLLQIVNEVLDYNRLISGKFTFNNHVFSLKELLDEVVFIVRPQAERKSLNMVTNFDLNGIEYIEGDPFRLKQILFNLLSNAIKFTMEGEVLLSVFYKRQGSHLHFTFLVKDTGIGLSEEETHYIFNEFEQAEGPEKYILNQTGAGLGLTIVKSLVENQGGRIYVKSKKGEGSSFTFYLQFTVAEKPLEETIKFQHQLPVAGLEVWVVDDDELILDLCSLIFQKYGIGYTCFKSPLEMLNADWNPKVGYVLMDIRMPEMSGIKLCKAMRAKIGEQVQIYAMTAQVLPEERSSLLEGGFNGLIMKPFKVHELLAIFGGQSFDLPAVPEEEAVSFDPSSVEKMTFGDRDQFYKIMHRFTVDCLHDRDEILAHLKTGDLEQLALLFHRLAGRIAQMASKELAAGFRKMELDLRAARAVDKKHHEEIMRLLHKLEKLVDVVEDYSIS